MSDEQEENLLINLIENLLWIITGMVCTLPYIMVIGEYFDLLNIGFFPNLFLQLSVIASFIAGMLVYERWSELNYE